MQPHFLQGSEKGQGHCSRSSDPIPGSQMLSGNWALLQKLKSTAIKRPIFFFTPSQTVSLSLLHPHLTLKITLIRWTLVNQLKEDERGRDTKILSDYYTAGKRQHWLVVGERAREGQDPGDPHSQRRGSPARALSRGCTHHPAVHRAHSEGTQTPPFAAGRFSPPGSRAWWPRAHGKVRPGQCGRGDGAQGQKAHLSQRNEGRGLAYLERKRLCLQRPPGLRFPEFPPGAGTQPPPPAAEVICCTVLPDYTSQNSQGTSPPS